MEYSEQELKLIQLVCDQVAIATARDQEREQQIKLERIAVAGQLAAKVAHEINNPLAAITNVLYLLEKTPLSKEATGYLAIVQEQLARVAHISKQTLSFYRDFRPVTAVNLRHAVDNAIAASAGNGSQKAVSFAVEIPHDLKVQAVDGELVQILINLVTNAVHYSPEHEKVRIAALCRNGDVEVFVSDRGPGIPSTNQANLFQPFFSTKKDNGGNGLGLWISRELARRMGGELVLAPSHEGATFVLRLHPAA